MAASARSYILDTKSVQRNSPLVIAAILTSVVKKYLSEIQRIDLSESITSVNFFQWSVIMIVTGKPIINFELRMYEWTLKEIFKKTLSQHWFSDEIFINYK